MELLLHIKLNTDILNTSHVVSLPVFGVCWGGECGCNRFSSLHVSSFTRYLSGVWPGRLFSLKAEGFKTADYRNRWIRTNNILFNASRF